MIRRGVIYLGIVVVSRKWLRDEMLWRRNVRSWCGGGCGLLGLPTVTWRGIALRNRGSSRTRGVVSALTSVREFLVLWLEKEM